MIGPITRRGLTSPQSSWRRAESIGYGWNIRIAAEEVPLHSSVGRHSKFLTRIREYDAAIVCVGFDNGTEGEGFDRTFQLPDGQDDLVNGVAEKNPNTIVILNSGGNVDMHRWLDKVPALLHAWYPGQEGGNALAKILFGDVNPSAKLPVTFEARESDNPAFKSYPSDSDGENVRYEEGIFVGYRGYDHFGIDPLFPFGFGLSYTQFEYSNLRIDQGESADRDEVEGLIRGPKYWGSSGRGSRATLCRGDAIDGRAAPQRAEGI